MYLTWNARQYLLGTVALIGTSLLIGVLLTAAITLLLL